MAAMPLISHEFEAESVSHEMIDELLAHGWRHFGTNFFRYNWQMVGDEWQTVVPVRIRLSNFSMTKSQRRVLRKNADVLCEWVPAEIDDTVREMFQRHKRRFTDNVPDDITSFLSPTPADVPGEGRMLRCMVEGRVVAFSFVDIGRTSVSSVYGIFEPSYSDRSLGIFTMLTEIEMAKASGFVFHYPGYVTSGSSGYDYKKQFAGLEGYDWELQTWRPFTDFPPVVIS